MYQGFMKADKTEQTDQRTSGYKTHIHVHHWQCADTWRVISPASPANNIHISALIVFVSWLSFATLRGQSSGK